MSKPLASFLDTRGVSAVASSHLFFKGCLACLICLINRGTTTLDHFKIATLTEHTPELPFSAAAAKGLLSASRSPLLICRINVRSAACR